jgi:hypothetical protein
MNKIRILCAAALAGATFAAAAQSDDARDTHWHAGVQVGSVHDNGKSEPSFQLTFGYDIDRIWSVEALLNSNMLFVRDGTDPTGPYEFDSAYGARVLATVPVSGNWSLVGGLGATTVHEERGLALHGYDRERGGLMVSGAAMYRVNRRWSLGLEVSSFTAAHTFNAGLKGEIHF